MYKRHIIFSLVKREYLAGKGSVVTTEYLLSGMMHDVVSDYNDTAAAKPDKHITRAVAIAFTDDLFHLLLYHSSLGLSNNQLQQLPPGVFSDLTSLRFLTCVVVCMENLCVPICV
jgi:hypothetical protein